ncbi:MAG TPA: biotin/lipoyl-binding protein, partial [Rhodoferax sp.]|nr:biotin/lipoyl-binding protein [Rhodoferax sp.]
MNAKALPKILILETVAACLLLVACGENKTGAGPEPAASAVGTATGASAPTSGGRAAGAPVSVSTVVARKRDFDIHIEAIGTVTPAASVDVKPQINSVVTKVHIKEGQFVKAGELLFTLDPRPDEANVAKVRAQMAKDEAVLADAQRQLLRSRDLLAKNFISQGALDTS